MSEYLNELYKNKDITDSSKSLYINKLLALNNKKPIKNLNYLLDIEDIKSKIAKFKNNTQRSYIVSVCSILKCYLNSNSKVNHKFKKTYDEYIKLLNNYNELLQDATAITDTEKTNWVTVDIVKDIHNKLKNKVSKMKSPYDLNDKLISLDLLILSLFYITVPRRNADYLLMKVIDNDEIPDDDNYNYLDLKNKKFIFNRYKTARTYKQQIIGIPEELFKIIKNYIDINDIKINEYLLINPKTGQNFTSQNAITVILNRLFEKKVSSSMLRKLFLTTKYSDTTNELDNDATKMGTSSSVIRSNYIKKI